MVDRRKFIGMAAGALVASTGCAGSRSTVCPAAAAKLNVKRKTPALADLTGGAQPNILFILTDQERYTGNLPATLNRPHFDRLTRNAASFSNTFCAYPLCSPSRSAIFTGLYPHQNGVTSNEIFPVGKGELPKDRPHLGSVLASVGYRIGYQGKWDLSRGPSYYTANVRDRGRAGDYGFEGHCGKVPDQEYGYAADDQVVNEACGWVREQRPGRPWFLTCSIINPHDICHPQLKPDRSIRSDAVLPASLHDDLSTKPRDQRSMRDDKIGNNLNVILHPGSKPFGKYDDTDWLRFLSFYYDLIEHTDNYVGRLLAALEDTGQLENTVIVYSSDHGELGGAHGFAGKHEAYEEDSHIPLYIYHPKLAASEVGAMVSNVSIAPTIASLAGVEWPGPVAGPDLSGHVNGLGAPESDAAFIEIEETIRFGIYNNVQVVRMVRTDRYKYSYSFEGVNDGQLYDLVADPIEMNNLFDDPGHAGLRRELEDRLKAWMRETGDRYQIGG